MVDKANYELVYSAPLTPGTSLEDIYTRFNIDHPKDFKGHSLSVSDVVVLHQNGQDAAHYVDSVGFQEVPEFLQEQKQLTRTTWKRAKQCQDTEGDFPCDRHEPGADGSRRIWLSPPVGRRKVSDYGERDAGVCRCRRTGAAGKPLESTSSRPQSRTTT